jgi:hypothetical protein
MKTKMLFHAFTALFFLCNIHLMAQTNIFPSTGAAGIGTTSPNTSSLLEIKSTTQGILIPRMTLTQRNAIPVASSTNGLLIYQTNSTPGFYYYNGSAWKAVTSKPGWLLTGNAGTNSSTNFIGTTDTAALVFKVNNTQAGLINDNGDVTAFGFQALQQNSGTSNTAIGSLAMVANTTGINNTATGADALHSNNGSFNTAVGLSALYNTTASEFNTAVGYGAGGTFDNGWNNVFIGANTDVNGPGYFNVIALGKNAICTASDEAVIGNSSTNIIGGFAAWEIFIPDVRVNKNIKQNVPGLAFINKLAPVTYNLDLDAVDRIIQPPQRKDATGKLTQPTQNELAARKAKEQVVYTGFIAQDVEKAAKSLNYDFSGVDAAKNDKDLYGLRYGDFVVPLVKGEQELSKENDSLKSVLSSLQDQINELKAMIVANQSTVSNQSAVVLSDASSLQQNIPNPFDHTTTINYTLPQTYSSAKIIITDNSGKTLKELSINAKGKGSLNIDASTLSSGAYQYSLIVDGRLIGTKQMILSK